MTGRIEDAARAYIDAIGAGQRPLFDRIDRLIRDVAPAVDVVLAYNMPTYKNGDRSLHVAVWKHGLSLYGWDEGRTGGLMERFPELSNGRGTMRVRPADAEKITDDELRAVIAGALVDPA